MQKTAQKRSILNRLREMTNVSGKAAEKFFNPQFQEVMENLRAIDDTIRSIATGQVIGGADPGADSVSLKDLLKSAKSNVNRREYMTAVAELGRFHKKLFDIVQQAGSLHNKVNEIHHQFLFQDLGDEHKKQLQDLKTRFAHSQQEALIKEASIMDFFYNIGTKRGRALSFYEKRYPKQIGKLKRDTASLLARSESLLGQLLSSLKEMASARATRNVDSYMRAVEKLTKGYQNYDQNFKDYYNSNIKGFLEKIELVSPTQKVEEKGLGKTEVPVPPKSAPELDMPEVPIPLTQVKQPGQDLGTSPTSVAPSSGEFGHVSIPPPPKVPSNVGPPVPVIPMPPDTIPEMSPPPMESSPTLYGVAPAANPPVKTPAWQTLPYTGAHRQFIESLESLSREDPLILSYCIKKYAQSIEHSDPISAIKLFEIVKSIRG